MSTNKTENYSLHSWVPQDEFHLTEINENFTKLDGKLHEEVTVLDKALKAEVNARTQQMAGKADKAAMAALGKLVIGTYKGTGIGSQTIDVGFPIRAVLVECFNGTRPPNNSYATQTGLVMPGFPLREDVIKVEGNTFTVTSGGPSNWWSANINDALFYYLAWVE